MPGYTLLLASDLERDGMACELTDGEGKFVAEVFRCDADKTLTLTGELQALPLAVVDWFIEQSKRRLDPFEDGTPLADVLAKSEDR